MPTPKRQHHREEKPKLKSKSSRSRSSDSSHPSNYVSSKEGESSREVRDNMENLDSGVRLKSSKRKRSVSCEPTDSDDYVLVAAPGPSIGFGVELGNIDEEAEVEAPEVDEFGARVARPSPRKKTTGGLRTPSVMDKRKMLGMTLPEGHSLHGPVDSYRTPGTPRGNSVRKTRKVSELIGYRDEVGEEGFDSKQKRARLG